MRLIECTNYERELEAASVDDSESLTGELCSQLTAAKASMVDFIHPSRAERPSSSSVRGPLASQLSLLAAGTHAALCNAISDRNITSIVQLLWGEARDSTLSHASFPEAKCLIGVLPK
jgi:hypothetical protein